jgi:ribonuclease HI
MVQEIGTVNLLNKQGKTIAFQWIPSHVEIQGNKAANLLAKKGTTLLSKHTEPNFKTIDS